MIASVTPIASGSSGLQALRSSADETPRTPAPARAAAATPQPRSAVVQISAQAGARAEVPAEVQAEAAAPAAQTGAPLRLAPAAAQNRAQDSATSRAIDLRYFDPADADKNGQISEFEQQAYDYRHPPTLAQQQLEQQQQQQLRAYAEVARAGQAAAQQ